MPGDLVHADVHGAVVIPHDVAPKIPEVVQRQMEAESTLIAASQREGFSAEVYPTPQVLRIRRLGEDHLEASVALTM